MIIDFLLNDPIGIVILTFIKALALLVPLLLLLPLLWVVVLQQILLELGQTLLYLQHMNLQVFQLLRKRNNMMEELKLEENL